jgi:hypothetical protein
MERWFLQERKLAIGVSDNLYDYYELNLIMYIVKVCENVFPYGLILVDSEKAYKQKD